MWVLPNFLEAQRAGVEKEWLDEFGPQGSANLNYQLIAGGSWPSSPADLNPFCKLEEAGELQLEGSVQSKQT